MADSEDVRARLAEGLVIPACPLALDARRKLDERRQLALFRYYAAAGAGGLAVGVHTTQFAIRDPKIGLFQPLLELAAAAMGRAGAKWVRIAGICGATGQAVGEAGLARKLGYDAGLLSLGALKAAGEDELLDHCRQVAEVIPLFGFYLQPAAGGRVLSYRFWRRLVEMDRVIAIKIAPFNRYQTLEVVRAAAESGRDDIALYTGNDDNIVMDLLTPFRFQRDGKSIERRIVGGLLGHWAVWSNSTPNAAGWRAPANQFRSGSCVRQRRSPTPTPRFSTRPTVTPAVSPACTRSCGAKACSRGHGVWTQMKN